MSDPTHGGRDEARSHRQIAIAAGCHYNDPTGVSSRQISLDPTSMCKSLFRKQFSPYAD